MSACGEAPETSLGPLANAVPARAVEGCRRRFREPHRGRVIRLDRLRLGRVQRPARLGRSDRQRAAEADVERAARERAVPFVAGQADGERAPRPAPPGVRRREGAHARRRGRLGRTGEPGREVARVAEPEREALARRERARQQRFVVVTGETIAAVGGNRNPVADRRAVVVDRIAGDPHVEQLEVVAAVPGRNDRIRVAESRRLDVARSQAGQQLAGAEARDVVLFGPRADADDRRVQRPAVVGEVQRAVQLVRAGGMGVAQAALIMQRLAAQRAAVAAAGEHERIAQRAGAAAARRAPQRAFLRADPGVRAELAVRGRREDVKVRRDRPVLGRRRREPGQQRGRNAEPPARRQGQRRAVQLQLPRAPLRGAAVVRHVGQRAQDVTGRQRGGALGRHGGDGGGIARNDRADRRRPQHEPQLRAQADPLAGAQAEPREDERARRRLELEGGAAVARGEGDDLLARPAHDDDLRAAGRRVVAPDDLDAHGERRRADRAGQPDPGGEGECGDARGHAELSDISRLRRGGTRSPRRRRRRRRTRRAR